MPALRRRLASLGGLACRGDPTTTVVALASRSGHGPALLLVTLGTACGPETTLTPGSSSESTATSSGSTFDSMDSASATETTGGSVIPPELVTAGFYGTSVITASGLAKSWGLTDYGTFGDDEPGSAAPFLALESRPLLITSGDPNCALLVDGSVTCWGENFFGALGYGDTLDRSAPPTGPVQLGGAAAGLSGFDFHCARFDDGTLQCWGISAWGRTGHVAGSCTNCDTPSCCIGDDEVPSDVPMVDVGAPVAEVSVGAANVCVLTPDGRVRTWGYANDGALGQGPDLPTQEAVGDDEAPSTSPDVELGGVATSVACGIPSCALLVDGTVRCWGGDKAGYGVMEAVGDDETPASMGPLPLPGPVKQIDGQSNHVCALLDDGTVFCWGSNNSGRLGLGHTDDIGDDETPVGNGPVDVGGAVVSISVGSAHACAVLDDGTLRCWGNNAHGQLGYGHTENIGDDETPAS